MKITELKKILKEVVKEVIQDELRGVLLEIIKSQNKPIIVTQPVNDLYEVKSQPLIEQQITETKPTFDVRNKYMNILNETKGFTEKDENPTFQPSGGTNLGVGEVDMEQIMGLMKK